MKAIKLMPDYQCSPLWYHESEDPNEFGEVDLDSIEISQELLGQLNNWASIYDSILNLEDPANSDFSSKRDEVNFVLEGYEIVDKLKDQLKVTVLYFDIIKGRLV
jgi:hypothetical protein